MTDTKIYKVGTYWYFSYYKCYLKVLCNNGCWVSFICLTPVNTNRCVSWDYYEKLSWDDKIIEPNGGFEFYRPKLRRLKSIRSLTKKELKMVKQLYG